MALLRKPDFSFAFILITIVLDMIGVGIILPVLPGLIEELVLPGMGAAAEEGLVARASVIGGYLIFSYAIMQFLFAPVLGNLSDRFGRRPVLLTSVFGIGVDYIIMAFAPVIAWLFIARMLSGIAGAAITTAMAYVTDITPPENRSRRFGLVGAAFGGGIIIGPVLGGLLGEFGHRMPFYVAAGVAFANFVLGYIVLPESLHMRKRRRFNFKRANPLGALMSLRRYPIVIWLIGALFLFALAGQAYPSVWNFFTIEMFQWTSFQIGASLGIFGLLFAISQAVLIGPVIKRFGESATVLIGMAAAAVAFTGTALIATPVGLYGYMVIGAMGGLATPPIHSMMSRQVADNAQGELQGGINAANSLTAIIGPIAFTQLFSFFTVSPRAPIYFPGVPFLAAAILILAALAVFTFTILRFRVAKLPSIATDPHTPTQAQPGQMVPYPDAETLEELGKKKNGNSNGSDGSDVKG